MSYLVIQHKGDGHKVPLAIHGELETANDHKDWCTSNCIDEASDDFFYIVELNGVEQKRGY